LKILHVDQISAELLLVSYSNGTTAVYTAEQLLTLTPVEIVSEDEADFLSEDGAEGKR
jgi:hypothetical protein